MIRGPAVLRRPSGEDGVSQNEAGDSSASRAPSIRVRLLLAIAIGAASMFICHAALERRHVLAADYTWPWRAARILLQGHDPYAVIQPTGHYPFDDTFNYPLPAALISIPLAPIPPEAAGAIFVGLSAALLAFLITRDDLHSLPLFIGAPFLKVLLAPQWSPLLAAAALAPGLQFLAVTKPNLGLAALAYRPTWRGAAGCVVFLAISVAILPSWPAAWWRAVSQATQYGAPVSYCLGPLLLLAALRYRTREGRLLLVMALVPQRLLAYDQLVLWLIPRRWWSSLLLSVLSWPVIVAWASPPAFGFPREAVWPLTELMAMLFIYLPVLYMVLRRPNEGKLPTAVESALARFTSAVRAMTRIPI